VASVMMPLGVAIAEPSPVELVLGVEMSYEEYAREVASRYGIDPDMFTWVINCESGFNKSAVNNQEKHTDGTTSSHGLLQFNINTFNWMAGEAGIQDGDPYNPWHAIEAGAWGMANGYGNHWTCYRNYNK